MILHLLMPGLAGKDFGTVLGKRKFLGEKINTALQKQRDFIPLLFFLFVRLLCCAMIDS